MTSSVVKGKREQQSTPLSENQKIVVKSFVQVLLDLVGGGESQVIHVIMFPAELDKRGRFWQDEEIFIN